MYCTTEARGKNVEKGENNADIMPQLMLNMTQLLLAHTKGQQSPAKHHGGGPREEATKRDASETPPCTPDRGRMRKKRQFGCEEEREEVAGLKGHERGPPKEKRRRRRRTSVEQGQTVPQHSELLCRMHAMWAAAC